MFEAPEKIINDNICLVADNQTKITDNQQKLFDNQMIDKVLENQILNSLK